MASLQKILIVADDHAGLRDAIAKAGLLEHYSGAEIEIVSVIDRVICTSDGETTAAPCIMEEEQQLIELVEPFRDEVAMCRTQVIWNEDPVMAASEAAQASNADLVIKPLARHRARDYLHTPLDWQLIRTLKAPLLLSKRNDWTTGGNILVAMDTSSKHAALNRHICENAQLLCELLGANLHLLTSVAAPRHGVSAKLIHEARKRKLDDLNLVAARNSLSDYVPHVHLGTPVSAIKALCTALDPTVTVIGTHARGGVNKLLLGNTAEAVIPKIESDVLTIQPT